MTLGWGPKEKRAVRREAAEFFRRAREKALHKTKEQKPVLSNYPPEFAETPKMLHDIPDVIAYRDPEDVGRFLAAFDLAIGRRASNTRNGFERLQVIRGDLFGSVLIGPIDGLSINDVRGKFVAGDIPSWMAMHAKWVIVFEPDIPKMSEGAFIISDELRSPVKFRLAAYEIVRKSMTVLDGDRQPVFEPSTPELTAVEGMTI